MKDKRKPLTSDGRTFMHPGSCFICGKPINRMKHFTVYNPITEEIRHYNCDIKKKHDR